MHLTPEEKSLAQEIGFDEDVCLAFKSAVETPLERFVLTTDDIPREIDGLYARVPEERAETFLPDLRRRLGQQGYKVFCCGRESFPDIQEDLVVMKTTDPFDIVRVMETDAPSYNLLTEDILARLGKWAETSRFDITGAGFDFVELEFETLPDDLCAFAKEIHNFCPDAVEQGIGLLRESDDPEFYEGARAFCPDLRVEEEDVPDARFDESDNDDTAEIERLSDTADEDVEDDDSEEYPSLETSLKLLAYSLHTEKVLFLWWD